MNPTKTTDPSGQRYLRFEEREEVRGIAFSLFARDEGIERMAYHLTSGQGPPDGEPPQWWGVKGSRGRGWVDVGVGGPGPDHVIVPDNAPPGENLLCTAHAADESCALVTVTS